MADDAAAPEGELSETTAAEPESTAIEATGDATAAAAEDETPRTPRIWATKIWATKSLPSRGCHTCSWR